MSQRVLIPGLVCRIITILVLLLAQAEARVLLVAGEEEGLGSPACGVFYDKWEVPGVPAAMLAMAGIGRELMAADDCIQKDQVATACTHWRRVLEVTDKLGPPFDQDRVGIEDSMHDHQCDPNTEQTNPEETRESSE